MSHPTPEDFAGLLAQKAGLTLLQAKAFLQAQADLAGEMASDGFPVPGIGLLHTVERPAREMVMQFGPKRGQVVTVPASRKLKFLLATAIKDAVFSDTPAMPDIFSIEWFDLYPLEEE